MQICAHSGSQSASADGDEDVVQRLVQLLRNLISDCSLPFDDLLVVERRNEGLSASLGVLYCRVVSLIESVSCQHNVHILFSEHAHGLDFLPWSGHRHIDGPHDLQLVAGKSHSLRVVSRRCADNAVLEYLRLNRANLVVCPANFVGAHHLQVLPLEIDVTAVLV